ncbi:pilus assembly protein [Actinotalea sp. K2]|uniref:pilus assembly protein n=1 Tax=Actinotalea sp. K2 TaxID=2939438 RepID=UPI0020176298|nr:pilus assembly protein [Actinotalea sp. K2]MCL3860399.1 pilus assembly protein [Actinotalea sp. K2]
MALVLLVPTVYLVLVLGRLQAAAFAADGAAREAARAVVTGGELDGPSRAVAAVALALDDQGFDPERAEEALSLSCSTEPCSMPGGAVTVVVRVEVDLPAVPSVMQPVVPLHIPVQATVTAPVDSFRGRR